MMQSSAYLAKHALAAGDAAILEALRLKASSAEPGLQTVQVQDKFDAMTEGVPPAPGVTFERDTIGGVVGTWVHPPKTKPGQVILYLHSGWLSPGSAKAHRSFVGHLATKVRAHAFIPEYRLAPEDPFPAAVRDVYRLRVAPHCAVTRVGRASKIGVMSQLERRWTR